MAAEAEVLTSAVVPNPAAPAAPEGMLPGTQIPIPVGTGVEGLTVVNMPFRTNGPAWYTPEGTVWSVMGCAVAQPGRYIQTKNNVIYETVNEMGKALFEIMWKYPDRMLDRSPSWQCLLDVYNMLIDARTRLANNTIADGAPPPLPEKFGEIQMFAAYPVPLFGHLGCVQQWLHRLAKMVIASITEAMQHVDNVLAYHTTRQFFNAVWAPLNYMLGDMAWRFFKLPRPLPSDLNFVIPAATWTAYTDSTGQSNVMTSGRPPMGYDATNLDLESIRGKPYSQIIGFLQPWPASSMLYSSGGIWTPTTVPNVGVGSGAGNRADKTNQSAAIVPDFLAPTSGLPAA